MIAAERIYGTRDALAEGLARDVAGALARAIADRGKAALAVSGGTTPKLFFEKLSGMDIAWSRVAVTLVDERQVPDSSERSNARLVRHHLLRARAAEATFIPLFGNAAAADAPPFDVAVLGMGDDGHTASFFPGGDRLREALDRNGTRRLIPMTAPGAGEARLTFTLPVLEASGRLLLHIEGAEKHAALARARGEGPVEDMPVRAVLRGPAAVTIYWCP